MTTPRPQAPQKPFESTYKKLFKAFAAAKLNLEQIKDIFASTSANTLDVTASDGIKEAQAGHIQAVTRTVDSELTTLGEIANQIMAQLKAPDVVGKLPAAQRASLENIHGQHQSTLKLLNDQLATVEKMRKGIYEAVTGKTLTSEQIIRLEKDIGKYASEVDALKKKIEPFVEKVELQAITVTPSIQSSKTTLTNK